MAKIVKCPECGTKNNKEDTEQHQRRYYCPSCLKDKLEKAEKSKSDWSQLIAYVHKIYNGRVNGMVYAQLGTYKKDPYNYTEMGMLLTLKYFHETLGNKTLDGRGVGIIPYIYQEAKENYVKKRDINANNQDKKLNNEVVYIKVTPTSARQNKNTIDFETLETSDE